MSCLCNLIRPSEAFESSASNSLGALASIHAFAWMRNAASCGVSSKFIGELSSSLERSPDAAQHEVMRCRAGAHQPVAVGPGSAEQREERCTASGTRDLPSFGRYLVEWYVLVDPDVTGQTKHALGDDVTHDLVGAAFDRSEEHTSDLQSPQN